MCPVLFQVGGLPIYSYGLMLAIAVAVGLFGALKLARIEGCEEDLIYELTIVMVVCGILGARLFYVVFYAPDYFAANPWAVLDLRTGGLVFYGGLLGGLLGGLGYIVKKRLSFWNLADIFAPFLALGYSIARIGCFLNGCCYGKPTELPWGVVFRLWIWLADILPSFIALFSPCCFLPFCIGYFHVVLFPVRFF